MLEITPSLITSELQFCSKVNEQEKRHYYLWYYRFRLTQLAKAKGFADVVSHEIKEMEQYIAMHLTDSSAKSYLESI